MSEDIELKFPFDEPAGAARSAWPLEQEPTDLLLLWPGSDEPPTQTEVAAAIAGQIGDGFEVLEEVEPPSPDVQWAVATRWGQRSTPVIIWTQPAVPVPPGELGDPEAEACRWVIGFETLLDPTDPFGSFIDLMRTLAGAFDDSPAIIDINSTMIHRHAHLAATYSADDGQAVEPAIDDLWMIHAVHAPDSEEDSAIASEPRGTIWLHTHGLWRCGLPELEMLEVPATSASTAAELLNDIAALMFEFPPPPPGEPYPVGEGLAVTFQPWRDVVATMPDGAPGGPRDRVEEEGENPHAGVRAVICGAEPRGAYRQMWAWPYDVVSRLESDEATIYMTHRATDRQAKLARSRWGEFAMAFASAQKAALVDVEDPSAVFLIKAGFPVDGAPGHAEAAAKEHLWFEVHRFQNDHVEATLINQPVNVPSLKRGERTCVRRADVSDWQVQTVAGSFGPLDLDELWRAIDTLKDGKGPNDGE